MGIFFCSIFDMSNKDNHLKIRKMKQLKINGTLMSLVFTGSDTEIVKWVDENLDRFDLNEEHSCSAHLESENLIVISGDEDRFEIELETVVVINL